ncbi:MAG: class I SAM-dependent methyltransferase [Myxococcaceae bacterium]|nr:class I SAM-dependent methyltransferase [Myxococcaceae bacterium]
MSPHPSRKKSNAPGAARPLREDLVTQAALEAYGAIRHEGRLADRALDFMLRSHRQLFASERRAVAERVYALLRRQRTVDWMLERVRPGFVQMTATPQDLLRLAASRVLHGESAREVARTQRLPDEDTAALSRLPDAAEALLALPFEERFPIQASLPNFLAQRFIEQLGAEAERAAEAMNERAPLTARVNTLAATREQLVHRLREEGVDCRPTGLSPLGITLQTRINAFSLRAFRDGLFELQDEGSQLLGMLVDPPPTRVVDACAGAGGKTLQLAAFMKNRGELFALDVDEGRLEELRRRARRAGVHNTRVRVIPATGKEAVAAVADLAGKADRVLVDAPCSGTGTFRRKPDARYRLTSEDLTSYVQRQKELLARFSVMVKPGGRLIYGTCSILREENEDVVADFVRAHPEFSVMPAENLLPPEIASNVTRDGYLRLFPHLHGTDGFFGAVLVKAK